MPPATDAQTLIRAARYIAQQLDADASSLARLNDLLTEFPDSETARKLYENTAAAIRRTIAAYDCKEPQNDHAS